MIVTGPFAMALVSATIWVLGIDASGHQVGSRHLQKNCPGERQARSGPTTMAPLPFRNDPRQALFFSLLLEAGRKTDQ